VSILHTRTIDHRHSALSPTRFIDSDNPVNIRFAVEHTADAHEPTEKGVALFYAVRDGVKYDLLSRSALAQDDFIASATLHRGTGFCIEKAVLLAALCRAVEIPCRLRFADVRNHLSTPKLLALMETDVFIYHGYVEMLLREKWVKATPAFDQALCLRHGVRPIEFDGTADAIFHEYDIQQNRHMEYVNEHGVFDDLPYSRIVRAFKATYPKIYTVANRG
jgi:transglutaminase-like putative cysteine protease